MTLNSTFLSTLANDQVTVDLWVEIEGLPYGYGLTSRTSSFFSGRATALQRLGVKANLVERPEGAEQEARPLEATCSIGQMVVTIADDDDGAMLPLVANQDRSDYILIMAPPATWVANTAYSVGDIRRPTLSSAAAGASCWFRCTTAGTSHANTEPTWPTSSTVADGTAVWTWMGNLSITATATAINIPFSGTADTTQYPASDGYVYIGRETLKYSARNGTTNGYFSGVTRGHYALTGFTATQAHNENDWISPYPRFLKSRRAAIYSTVDGSDTNKITRWAGKVSDVQLVEGLSAAQLTMDSPESELNVTLFANQRKAKLRTAIADGAGVYVGDDGVTRIGNVGYTTTQLALETSSTQGQTWTDNEYIYIRVEDEFMLGQVDVAADGTVVLTVSSSTTGRGLSGSVAVQHEAGADVIELMNIRRFDSGGTLENTRSEFSAGDHPLDVALALLTSTGSGSNGAWDVLPAGWGAGIDVDRFDTDSITAIKEEWIPPNGHEEYVEEPFNLGEKLVELLQPIRCYPVSLLDNKFAIRRLSSPMPGDTTKSLTTSTLTAIPGIAPEVRNVIGRVLLRCDWDPIQGEYRKSYTVDINTPGSEAQDFDPAFETLEIESKGQHSGSIASGFSVHGTTSPDLLAETLADLVRERYAKPPSMYLVECDYTFLESEPGDWVLITESNIPNTATGSRSVSSLQCAVRKKKIDDVAGRVYLTVVPIPLTSQYRRLSPSATVSSYNAGTATITVNANDFTASPDTDAGCFLVGDTIQVLRDGLSSSRGTGTIQSISGNDIVLTAALASAAASGDIVVIRDYDDATSTRRAKSAFCCGYAQPPKLGPTALAAPHQYGS